MFVRSYMPTALTCKWFIMTTMWLLCEVQGNIYTWSSSIYGTVDGVDRSHWFRHKS